MMIKNSGFVPNTVPNTYFGNKVTQPASAQDKSNAVKLDKISNPQKMDSIEISKRPESNRPTLSQVRDQIVSDLNQDKSASFLEALKDKVNSNQYKIDPKELAKIMLTGENNE